MVINTMVFGLIIKELEKENIFFKWSIYEGDFVEDKYHGRGIMTYANGDKYEGEWKDDLRNGKGKLIYANGEIYEGEFQNDNINGKGTLTWTDGDKYVGEFKNNYRQGKGIFMCDVEMKYDSKITYKKQKEIEKDISRKKGIFIGIATDKTKGLMIFSKAHGAGSYGIKCEGEWDRGVAQGKCKVLLKASWDGVGGWHNANINDKSMILIGFD